MAIFVRFFLDKNSITQPMKEKKKNKRPEAISKSFFQKTNDFFEKNQKIFLVISMIAGMLICMLLFDVKVSLSGDDSAYLINAEEFWRHFRYPEAFGALYPIIISPIVGMFGYKLILLKMVSCIFMLAFLWFFYQSFRGKVSAAILCPALLLISTNSYIFFYAVQTYSEALFMLIQALFFCYFCKYFVVKKESDVCLKSDLKKYVLLGGLILALGLTRTIGYGAIGAVIVFFIVEKKWKEMIYCVSAFVAVFVLFQTIKYLIWSGAGLGYDLNSMLAKDHYNPVERESFAGFVNRFIENSQLYLSVFLCQFFGVIKESLTAHYMASTFRTLCLYLLYFCSIGILLKKNKPLLFTGIYVGIMLFATFLVVHAFWKQDRFILVYYPLILIFLSGGFYYLFQLKALRKFYFVYLLILFVCCVGTLSITINRIGRNLPVLQENLFGNQLFGLTPDWQNFIKGSQWAAQHIDKEAVIVSRKPSISRIYTGRDFVWSPTEISVPFDVLTQIHNTDDNTTVVIENTMQNPYIKYIINFREPLQFKEKKVSGVTLLVIPNTELDGFVRSLEGMNIGYSLDYKAFFDSMQDENILIYDPDIMLNNLMETEIRYFLLPQLRIEPTRYTGFYINNVHRLIWFISGKYPNRFRNVHVEGKEEPCEIVEFIR